MLEVKKLWLQIDLSEQSTKLDGVLDDDPSIGLSLQCFSSSGIRFGILLVHWMLELALKL